MKHIKFKRKAKAFATLGGLATVSSLVLAACSDNSATITKTETKKDVIDPVTLANVTTLVTSHKDAFQSLLNIESSDFKSYVSSLNFDKDFTQAVISDAKSKLGTKTDNGDNILSSSNTTEISNASAYGLVNKIKKDLETESTKSNSQTPVKQDQVNEFAKLFTAFTTAIDGLAAEFNKLPTNAATSNTLDQLATKLNGEADKFLDSSGTVTNTTDFDTALTNFVKGVNDENDKYLPFLKSALALTKATSAINTFAEQTDLQAFAKANNGLFASEVAGLVTKVSKQILGVAGQDLFVKGDIPEVFEGSTKSTQVYGLFSKLLKVDDKLAALENSAKMVKLYKALVDQNEDAIKLLAKSYKDITLTSDFARLNAYLSFDNANLNVVFEQGQNTGTALTADKKLSTISTTLSRLANNLAFLTGTGETDLSPKLTTLKAGSGNGNDTKIDDVNNAITAQKTNINNALDELKQVNATLTSFQNEIESFNNTILNSNGFEGMLNLLTEVQSLKDSISKLHSYFEVPTGSETSNGSQVKKLLTAIQNQFDTTTTNGIAGKLKTLLDDNPTNKTEITNLVGEFSSDNFTSGKFKELKDDLTTVIGSYDSLLNGTTVQNQPSSLNWISDLLQNAYKPSPLSQTFKLFSKLANEFVK